MTAITIRTMHSDRQLKSSPTPVAGSRGGVSRDCCWASRMVPGHFRWPEPGDARSMWDYPATAPNGAGPWDPDRNTDEFVAAMKLRGASGGGFTINLQGRSPQGYSKAQPWHNSAFTASEASARPLYMAAPILDEADALGMVAIVESYFYFSQDERLEDEQSVIRATESATDLVCLREG